MPYDFIQAAQPQEPFPLQCLQLLTVASSITNPPKLNLGINLYYREITIYIILEKKLEKCKKYCKLYNITAKIYFNKK